MSKLIAGLAREYHPGVKVILSTWLFDCREANLKADEAPRGEWEGLSRAFASRPDWVDYILADSHGDFPAYPLERGVPGGLPMLNFPEISMWGMSPWGGLGANPLPERFQRLWSQARESLSGGFPYSEGIFEDLNKVLYSQWYWDQDRSAEETAREYISYEFSPEVVDDVWAAIRIMERNHRYCGWHRLFQQEAAAPRDDLEDAGSEEAYALMARADSRLGERARNAWRWRILYLRALVDRERFANRGLPTDRCEEAFDELTRIYHAERAERQVAPPTRRAREAARKPRGGATGPATRGRASSGGAR
jgi:hypothetical protein